jgi:SecY translocase
VYCPNPDCKHRLKTGQAAEYLEGTNLCKDCGAQLQANNPVAPQPKIACPQPLKKRLLTTLAVVSVLWLGYFLPPLFIDTQALQGLLGVFNFSTAHHFGPLSLGVRPFLAGFVLVEIIALIVPKLRRRRHGDPALRRKLTVASLITGLAFALVNGYSIALYLESLNYQISYRMPEIVYNPGWLFRIQISLTLAAGSCLFVAAAHFINRFGVGSGFAVVILAEILSALPGLAQDSWLAVDRGLFTPLQMVLLGVVLFGLFAGVRWFLLLGDRKPEKIPIRLPTCGTFPIELAVAATLLFSTVSWWVDWTWLQRLAEKLVPGTKFYLWVDLVMIAVFVPLASTMFYWRRRKVFKQSQNRWIWYKAQFHSALFFFAIVIAWYILYRRAPESAWLVPSSLIVLAATALVADLWSEIRARWRAPGGADLVVLEAHQDMADTIEALAKFDRGRGAVVQGLQLRSLAYFFGPFVPLVILGTADQKPDPEP